jgi:hypothetical protein
MNDFAYKYTEGSDGEVTGGGGAIGHYAPDLCVCCCLWAQYRRHLFRSTLYKEVGSELP